MLEQPDARPIEGGKYRLHDAYTYVARPITTRKGFVITVPEGFVWDGASVPQFLWSISGIRPDGLLRAAALVHDYLYRHSGDAEGASKLFTRKEADVLFYDMIREAGGGWWTAIRAYRAVRLFGWWAWKS